MSEQEATIFVAANELEDGKLVLPLKKEKLALLLTYIADVVKFESIAVPNAIDQLLDLYANLKATPNTPGPWAVIELDQRQLGALNSAMNVSATFINRYGTFEFKTSVPDQFRSRLKHEVREIHLEYYIHCWGTGPILIEHLEKNHDLLYQFFFILSNHKDRGDVHLVAHWVKDRFGAHRSFWNRWFKRQWYKRVAMPGVVLGNLKQRQSSTHCSIYVQTLLQTINGLMASDQFDLDIYQLAIQSGYNLLKKRARHWSAKTRGICEGSDEPDPQCPATSEY